MELAPSGSGVAAGRAPTVNKGSNRCTRGPISTAYSSVPTPNTPPSSQPSTTTATSSEVAKPRHLAQRHPREKHHQADRDRDAADADPEVSGDALVQHVPRSVAQVNADQAGERDAVKHKARVQLRQAPPEPAAAQLLKRPRRAGRRTGRTGCRRGSAGVRCEVDHGAKHTMNWLFWLRANSVDSGSQ